MNCDVCGTELTQFNATSFRHVHDAGNCAQVLLSQRDAARAALRAAETVFLIEREDAEKFRNERDAARAQLAAAQERERAALHWEDVDDEWTEVIDASHPCQGGSHENYATAMRMVGHRHSKGQLVSLVCWLLTGRASADAPSCALCGGSRRVATQSLEHQRPDGPTPPPHVPCPRCAYADAPAAPRSRPRLREGGGRQRAQVGLTAILGLLR